MHLLPPRWVGAQLQQIVYDLNPGGIDTTNGHTIGAQALIPDSTVRQYAQTSHARRTIDCDGNPLTETIQVRAYDPEKNCRCTASASTTDSRDGPDGGRMGYQKIGPLALRCMSCHQVHNAIERGLASA